MSSAAAGPAPKIPFVAIYDLASNLDAVWLRRELGIAVQRRPADEIVALASETAGRVGLVVTDPQSYRPIVDAAPPRSLVLMQLYDERYRTESRELATQPSVVHAFRTFSLDLLPTLGYLAVVSSALADTRRASTAPRQVGAALKSGRSIRRATRYYAGAGTGRFTTVPIGYTATFAAAYAARFGPLPNEGSLFEAVLHDGIAPATLERDAEVSFRGARGQLQRRTGVHLAARVPGAECPAPVSGFSGHGDALDAEAYVDLMARSRFALCPPGYSTNESYRVFEALLCGALPTMLSTAVSQGTRPADHLRDVVSGPSWTSVLRRMQAIDEPTRVAAVNRARHAVRAAFGDAAAAIRTALSTP